MKNYSIVFLVLRFLFMFFWQTNCFILFYFFNFSPFFELIIFFFQFSPFSFLVFFFHHFFFFVFRSLFLFFFFFFLVGLFLLLIILILLHLDKLFQLRPTCAYIFQSSVYYTFHVAQDEIKAQRSLHSSSLKNRRFINKKLGGLTNMNYLRDGVTNCPLHLALQSAQYIFLTAEISYLQH